MSKTRANTLLTLTMWGTLMVGTLLTGSLVCAQGFDEFEDGLEEELEEGIEEELEGGIEEEFEQELEEDIEQELEEDIEEGLEQELEEDIEEGFEEELEEGIEEDLEQELEEDIQDELEQDVEEDIEDELEEDVEAEFEKGVEGEWGEELDEGIEEELDDALEDDVEEEAEEDLDETLEEELEENTDEEAHDEEDEPESEDEREEDEHEGDERENDEETEEDTHDGEEHEGEHDESDEQSNEETLEKTELDEGITEYSYEEIIEARLFEETFELDEEGFPHIKNRLVVFTDKASLRKLQKLGFDIVEQTELRGLDGVLAEIIEPDDFEREAMASIKAKILSSSFEIDYEHIYLPNTSLEKASAKKNKNASSGLNQGQQPYQLMPLKNTANKGDVVNPYRIGLIDTHVDTSHSVFADCDITEKSFINLNQNTISYDHGTAVASIMCGRNNKYRGLVPKMSLFSAGVFSGLNNVGPTASVSHLILALDWLVTSGVQVVNMSLSGPPNRVLKSVLERVAQKGIIVVAAAGNGGPNGKPLYPAAYVDVIAVTAVTKRLTAYFRANRGDYIDLSAPGVNIIHALPNERFGQSSGTSFASPFITILAARLAAQKSTADEVKGILFQNVEDLGKPGRDIIYGYGLAKPAK